MINQIISCFVLNCAKLILMLTLIGLIGCYKSSENLNSEVLACLNAIPYSEISFDSLRQISAEILYNMLSENEDEIILMISSRHCSKCLDKSRDLSSQIPLNLIIAEKMSKKNALLLLNIDDCTTDCKKVYTTNSQLFKQFDFNYPILLVPNQHNKILKIYQINDLFSLPSFK